MKRFLVVVLALAWPALLTAETFVLRMKVEHLTCLACAERFKAELAPLCHDLALDTKKGEAVCQYEGPVTPKEILKKAQKSGLRTSQIKS